MRQVNGGDFFQSNKTVAFSVVANYGMQIGTEEGDDSVSGETTARQVIVYADESGREPFKDWLYSLRDVAGRKRILARLSRLEQGNFGDCAPVGDGVSELRLFFGSGYRVYFGEHGECVVVLLCGGDKSSQSKDIEQAKGYWKEYLDDEKIHHA